MKSLLSPAALSTSSDIPILQEKRNHHLGSIYCIDWSKSGSMIATGSNDKVIKIINYHTFEEISKLSGHRGIIRSICFTHDETRLLSAGQVDTQIKVWDVEKGKNIANLEGHT
jgi:WD40 repeat protein